MTKPAIRPLVIEGELIGIRPNLTAQKLTFWQRVGYRIRRLFNPKLAWVDIANDPLTATTTCKHRVEFVSRHSIAESGLTCPVCGAETCERGDFLMVRKSRLGEVVICQGARVVESGAQLVCGMFLVASPDTEHGDNILWDRIPAKDREKLFYRFRRIDESKALTEKYGEDILMKDGVLIASSAKTQAPEGKIDPPRIPYKVGEVFMVSDGTLAEVVELINSNTDLFSGWAKVKMHETEIWHVDFFGRVRRSMNDASLDDSLQLTYQVKGV